MGIGVWGLGFRDWGLGLRDLELYDFVGLGVEGARGQLSRDYPRFRNLTCWEDLVKGTQAGLRV